MTSGTRSLSVVAAASFLFATYSQYGWRREHELTNTLKARESEQRKVSQFLAPGDQLSDVQVGLVSPRGPTTLASVVDGRRTIVYFEKVGCGGCDWIDSLVKTRYPHWRDKVTIVSAVGSQDSARGMFWMDSAGLQTLPGVPAVVAIDSTGVITHAALGLKRALGVFALLGIPAPSVDEMLAVATRPADQLPRR